MPLTLTNPMNTAEKAVLPVFPADAVLSSQIAEALTEAWFDAELCTDTSQRMLTRSYIDRLVGIYTEWYCGSQIDATFDPEQLEITLEIFIGWSFAWGSPQSFFKRVGKAALEGFAGIMPPSV